MNLGIFMFLILTPAIKRVSLVFAILFVSDMHYSLILLSNNASMDADQSFLPIYESKQN